MSISLACRKERDKKGFSTLFVRVKQNDKDVKIYTRLKVLNRLWDKRNKRIKSNHPFFEQISKQVKSYINLTEELSIQMKVSKPSIEEIKHRINGGSSVNDVLTFLDLYYKSSIRESTKKDYKSTLNGIKTHFKVNILTFEDLCSKSNWEELRENLKLNNKSPNTFNSYLKKAKAIHNSAFKQKIIFRDFPHVTYNEELSPDPKWITCNELMTIIKNVDVKSSKFEKDAVSILLYLLSFSMRGLYKQDLENLSSDNFINNQYSDQGSFNFGRSNTVYRHKRSKTGKIGYIFIGILPIENIIKSLHFLLKSNQKGLFPLPIKSKNFWDLHSKNFKSLTGNNYKSSRKAFMTVCGIAGVLDQDARELLFQKDRTISRYYKDNSPPELLLKYSKLHLKVLEKYKVMQLFNELYFLIQKRYPKKLDLNTSFLSNIELNNSFITKLSEERIVNNILRLGEY